MILLMNEQIREAFQARFPQHTFTLEQKTHQQVAEGSYSLCYDGGVVGLVLHKQGHLRYTEASLQPLLEDFAQELFPGE